jgi:hypothetical protein
MQVAVHHGIEAMPLSLARLTPRLHFTEPKRPPAQDSRVEVVVRSHSASGAGFPDAPSVLVASVAITHFFPSHAEAAET